MSETSRIPKPEFIPDLDALQAVERVIRACRELHVAKVALSALPPESLRAAFVYAEHISDVGNQIENTDEVDEAYRSSTMSGAEDARSTARSAIRRNAANLMNGTNHETERSDLGEYDKATIAAMSDASFDVTTFALQHAPGEAAKSIYLR